MNFLEFKRSLLCDLHSRHRTTPPVRQANARTDFGRTSVLLCSTPSSQHSSNARARRRPRIHRVDCYRPTSTAPIASSFSGQRRAEDDPVCDSVLPLTVIMRSFNGTIQWNHSMRSLNAITQRDYIQRSFAVITVSREFTNQRIICSTSLDGCRAFLVKLREPLSSSIRR